MTMAEENDGSIDLIVGPMWSGSSNKTKNFANESFCKSGIF